MGQSTMGQVQLCIVPSRFLCPLHYSVHARNPRIKSNGLSPEIRDEGSPLRQGCAKRGHGCAERRRGCAEPDRCFSSPFAGRSANYRSRVGNRNKCAAPAQVGFGGGRYSMQHPRGGSSGEWVRRRCGTAFAKPLPVKLDPKYLTAARELRDRWLEQVSINPQALQPVGKYTVNRALAAPPSPLQLSSPSNAAA